MTPYSASNVHIQFCASNSKSNLLTASSVLRTLVFISFSFAAVPQRQVQLDEAASEARIRRDGGGGHGVTGPVHTYVKTDKHANFKWGVRHHVGHHYAG
ncbi:hypothetical protein J437_LFUL014569 [Ladona fulva]|uniref:Uncharacterized protein n=1 Tax=Ladona fulva TaxID=123851 RepID=A0A8K0P6G7_LADFU|nr:hypothetical protein J437_LFUL014569 [Ladona fulva]